MAEETLIGGVIGHPVATNFIYPFLLVFFIVFAILEKTKILGEGQKQINALVSLVIGFIFITAVSPKMVVGNMVLFLTVALVVFFVVLLLWGFVSGKEIKDVFGQNKKLKIAVVILIVVAVVVALLSALGFEISVLAFLFNSSWSGTFWTTVLFIGLIAAAIAVVWKSSGSGGSS